MEIRISTLAREGPSSFASLAWAMLGDWVPALGLEDSARVQEAREGLAVVPWLDLVIHESDGARYHGASLVVGKKNEKPRLPACLPGSDGIG